jgi:hypothetical protein
MLILPTLLSYSLCILRLLSREAQAQQEPISLIWTSNKLISMLLFPPKAKSIPCLPVYYLFFNMKLFF